MSPTIIVEKHGLLPLATQQAKPWTWGHFKFASKMVLLALCLIPLADMSLDVYRDYLAPEPNIAHLCSQPPALTPSVHADLWQELGQIYETKEFVDRAANWLGGAIRIPTPSFDRMGPIDEDERWKAFGPLHEYLLSSFPNVHASLALTKINTYGLVYEWTGSNSGLKPLLLAGHQDVVPVNPDTVDEWTHPPFSGFYDGENVWGRGTSDDKNGLIGILSTIEVLLEKGFKPARTIVLAFGFDEETSGLYGARSIAGYLLETYGKDAFAMLVDEGGDYMEDYGTAIATIGTAEKGYFDVRIEVESPGGHSSVPPKHTTIGILSALLVHVEQNPSESHLNRGTPMYERALCVAAHAPDVPSRLRRALKRSPKSDRELRRAEKILFENHFFKALVETTQAVDLIQGGVKTNALPESAWAVVNHRIATDSSVVAVQEHDTEVLIGIAQQYNLSLTAFGKQISKEDVPTYGKLTLSDAWGASLSPAPITPTGTAAPFQLIAGTVKATYDRHRGLKDSNGVVVSPGHMSGNTDTRHYWQLTSHIFRYNHHFTGKTPVTKYIHTVNEFIEVDSYIEQLRFFTALILNVDEATTL